MKSMLRVPKTHDLDAITAHLSNKFSDNTTQLCTSPLKMSNTAHLLSLLFQVLPLIQRKTNLLNANSLPDNEHLYGSCTSVFNAIADIIPYSSPGPKFNYIRINHFNMSSVELLVGASTWP